jgi:hypothetical protein
MVIVRFERLSRAELPEALPVGTKEYEPQCRSKNDG